MAVDPVMEILCRKDAKIPWQIKIYKNDSGEFYSCVRTATWSAISDTCADMLAELEDLIDA